MHLLIFKNHAQDIHDLKNVEDAIKYHLFQHDIFEVITTAKNTHLCTKKIIYHPLQKRKEIIPIFYTQMNRQGCG